MPLYNEVDDILPDIINDDITIDDDTPDDVRSRLTRFYEDNDLYLIKQFNMMNKRAQGINLDKYTDSNIAMYQYLEDDEPSRLAYETKNKKREKFTTHNIKNRKDMTHIIFILFIFIAIFITIVFCNNFS